MTLAAVALDGLSPARLWSRLEPDVRLLAARSLYAHPWGENPAKREADVAIAMALRFREQAVRQLPTDKRAQYLARNVQPSETLASSLLLALHLEQRRAILREFLGALEIPNDDGVIAEDHDLEAPPQAKLAAAVARISEAFPGPDVEVYLLTLLALDPESWGGLEAILRERA